ncbi:hypothetical protein SAY86_012690 [Trapa natans]|uniref:Uncharacterized protein n=1 Tax=Trapa natans TaxID=22666 RepID=A0AAN7LX40_TRANT|nr:hypothetical protein SAY86_012690 [Trapa natans]
MLAVKGCFFRMRRRSRRLLFLLLCSPVIILFMVFTFPILCLAELCPRFFLGGSWNMVAEDDGEEEGEEEDGALADERLLECEEGRCFDSHEREREVGLLQRYLEDQLSIAGVVYECGDDFDCNFGYGGPPHNDRSPLLA